MKQITVDLAERSYSIYIAKGLLSNPKLVELSRSTDRRVMIVTNNVVAPLYLSKLQQNLAQVKPKTVILPDGEAHKTWSNLEKILDSLLTCSFDRSDLIIALGGGVTGDIAGFAAHCYMRGIDYVQMPTTLLAQVDSSVGGKTAINHPLGKNMIGAFHQPQTVLIDPDTLNTLPTRQYLAGLAEVIKYGIIGDAAFFAWLEGNIQPLIQRDSSALAYAIAHSCRNKAKVVALDETEQGSRALLNFGHTFAHAIEKMAGYGHILHGEAVAMGMVMAGKLATKLGRFDSNEYERIRVLVSKAGLNIKPPKFKAEVFLQQMNRDKKVLDGTLRLILPVAIGKCIISSDFETALLVDVLTDIFNETDE